MIKNMAEYIFNNSLGEISSIKKDGVSHSEEYFESLIKDANLPEKDKNQVLLQVIRATDESIQDFTKQHRAKAHEVALMEYDEDYKKALIKKNQRADAIHLFELIFAALCGILTTVLMLSSSAVNIVLAIPTLIFAAIVITVLAYAWKNRLRPVDEFGEDLKNLHNHLDYLSMEISRLETLRAWAKKTLTRRQNERKDT